MDEPVDAAATGRAVGLRLEWSDGRFDSVRRGDASLVLRDGSQGCAGTRLHVAVSDADALHAEYAASRARIRHPPTSFPWRSRELHVSDPDGHVLRFGSEARAGDPPGPWIDEQGAGPQRP